MTAGTDLPREVARTRRAADLRLAARMVLVTVLLCGPPLGAFLAGGSVGPVAAAALAAVAGWLVVFTRRPKVAARVAREARGDGDKARRLKEDLGAWLELRAGGERRAHLALLEEELSEALRLARRSPPAGRSREGAPFAAGCLLLGLGFGVLGSRGETPDGALVAPAASSEAARSSPSRPYGPGVQGDSPRPPGGPGRGGGSFPESRPADALAEARGGRVDLAYEGAGGGEAAPGPGAAGAEPDPPAGAEPDPPAGTDGPVAGRAPGSLDSGPFLPGEGPPLPPDPEPYVPTPDRPRLEAFARAP